MLLLKIILLKYKLLSVILLLNISLLITSIHNDSQSYSTELFFHMIFITGLITSATVMMFYILYSVRFEKLKLIVLLRNPGLLYHKLQTGCPVCKNATFTAEITQGTWQIIHCSKCENSFKLSTISPFAVPSKNSKVNRHE